MQSDFAQPEVLRLLGGLAALLGALAFLPYLRDTFAGRTHPQRASWLIWSILSALTLVSQIWEGAGASLGFAAAKVGGTVLVCTIAIWRGSGTFWDRRDIWVLGCAGLGLGLWAATDTAVYALAISIAVSCLAGSVTVVKAYTAPESETVSMWLVSCAASALALAAVGRVDPVLMAYPLYLLGLNGAIVLAIFAGRAKGAPHLARV